MWRILPVCSSTDTRAPWKPRQGRRRQRGPRWSHSQGGSSKIEHIIEVNLVRAHLDYVTQTCNIRRMTIWSHFKNELGILKTKSLYPTSYPLVPPPGFVLSVPNPSLSVIKLSWVRYHMVSSSSVNDPLPGQSSPCVWQSLRWDCRWIWSVWSSVFGV